MATEVAQEGISETLKRHIEENDKLAAELRQRYGDPAAYLGAFLRERFSPEAFLEDPQGHRVDRSSWSETEDLEDDGR